MRLLVRMPRVKKRRRRGESDTPDASHGSGEEGHPGRWQGEQSQQPQWPRRAGDLRGKREGRSEEIQGKRSDWSSARGVRLCVPSDWWRESSR